MAKTEVKSSSDPEGKSRGLSKSMSALKSGSQSDIKKISKAVTPEKFPKEKDGREGPDPTRYGDWERNGRCIDF